MTFTLPLENDQNNALYLLKTGIVHSLFNNILVGEYNDGSSLKLNVPEFVQVVPNTKIYLYRFDDEEDLSITNLITLADAITTYYLVFDNNSQIVRVGVGKTTSEWYNSNMR